MMQVIKTYGHERGLSATFRQHRCNTHCRFIHGYALAFTLTFECPEDEVDDNGWVIDFGGLKKVEQFLKDNFDHKYLAAGDDPLLSNLERDEEEGLIQLIVLPDGVGCEAFTKYVAMQVEEMLACGDFGDTQAQLVSVEVREHGSNGARYVL